MSWDPGKELILSVKSENGESIQKVSLLREGWLGRAAFCPLGMERRGHTASMATENPNTNYKGTVQWRGKAHLITVTFFWFIVCGAFNSMG